jgi:hypothetical protein
MHRKLTTQILALTKGTMLESNLAAHVDLSTWVLRAAGNCSSNSDITKSYPPICKHQHHHFRLNLNHLDPWPAPSPCTRIMVQPQSTLVHLEGAASCRQFPSRGGETSGYVMWDVGWHIDGDGNAAHHWRCQPVYSTQLDIVWMPHRLRSISSTQWCQRPLSMTK